MNVPAKYRQVIYWIVLVATVIVGVLTGLDLVPADAVSKGGEAVLEILTVIGAFLALRNIKPDATDEGGEI
jgi:hypothetical protein